MIRLNVFIRTTESNRAEILSVAKELVTASLKDEGCIAYDIFESATRQDVLMICETWSAAKALAALAGEDIQSYAEQTIEAGADLTGRTAEDVFSSDFKAFSRGDVKFGVGQST